MQQNIPVFILLVCALSTSTSILYLKWIDSQQKLAIQDVKIQLIQQQLDHQMVLIQTLRDSSLANSSSIQVVQQGGASDNTFIYLVVGFVSVGAILYILFVNNRADPFIGLPREMTGLTEIVVEPSIQPRLTMAEVRDLRIQYYGAQTSVDPNFSNFADALGREITVAAVESPAGIAPTIFPCSCGG